MFTVSHACRWIVPIVPELVSIACSRHYNVKPELQHEFVHLPLWGMVQRPILDGCT
jgi:hypothetical protein